MDAVLAATRAAHFASTLLVFGEIVLALFVARPAWRGTAHALLWESIEARIRVALLASLAVSALSGVLWLALEVPLMSGERLSDAITGPTLGIVVTKTSFGRIWTVRAIIAVVLFAWLGFGARGGWASPVSLLLAGIFLVSLAYAGHAAGAQGAERFVRLGVDMLHLAAAGAWLGALPGLALMLLAARRSADTVALGTAARATRRFSRLGMASVATLLATGVMNAIDLVGSFEALATTDYGRWLLAKLGFVAIMLALAAVNRLHLSPRLDAGEPRSASAIARNALLETAAGVAVLAIVGVLGITVPGIHSMHETMHHQLHSGTSRAIIPSASSLHAHG